MKVIVELLCWNEQYLLPLTIAHYKQIADKIVVWDNHSTDQSRTIAKALGAEVRSYGHKQLDDREYIKVKNQKDTSGEWDWRIVCDMDEILMITREQLEEENENGTTVLQVAGFNIYSDLMANSSLLEIDTGFPDPCFSKNVCYNPKQVSSMNYDYGAHTCKPSGRIFFSRKTYQLRHYRCIGGVQRMIDRHAAYKKRMCQFNLDNRLSFHYLRTEEEIHQEWARNIVKARK